MNTIYLTVDVECHDISKKNLYIDGKVGDSFWGLSKILEIGKEYEIPINFFVDVVECHEYGDNYIKEIVDLIHSYEQKVYLHIHPNFLIGRKYHYIWQYSEEEQEGIISDSISDFRRLVGYSPKAIRTGGYCNDQYYYEALEKITKGDMIDLSHCVNYRNSFYQSPTTNQIHLNGNVKVLPNTRFLCFKLFKWSKYANLDIMSANMNEMERVLQHKELSYMTCTMHSWTFLKHFFYIPKTLRPDKRNIRKMQKFIKMAKEQGWLFRNFEKPLSIAGNDSKIDLCNTYRGRILGIINTFFRMQRAARVNKKYFTAYVLFYAVIVLIIILFICLI